MGLRRPIGRVGVLQRLLRFWRQGLESVRRSHTAVFLEAGEEKGCLSCRRWSWLRPGPSGCRAGICSSWGCIQGLVSQVGQDFGVPLLGPLFQVTKPGTMSLSAQVLSVLCVLSTCLIVVSCSIFLSIVCIQFLFLTVLITVSFVFWCCFSVLVSLVLYFKIMGQTTSLSLTTLDLVLQCFKNLKKINK